MLSLNLNTKSINYTCLESFNMILIVLAKMLVVAGSMITLAGAAIGTGIVFAGYLSGAARNPEEAENLFNSTLMGFALIETFVFMSFLIAGTVYFFV